MARNHKVNSKSESRNPNRAAFLMGLWQGGTGHSQGTVVGDCSSETGTYTANLNPQPSSTCPSATPLTLRPSFGQHPQHPPRRTGHTQRRAGIGMSQPCGSKDTAPAPAKFWKTQRAQLQAAEGNWPRPTPSGERSQWRPPTQPPFLDLVHYFCSGLLASKEQAN